MTEVEKRQAWAAYQTALRQFGASHPTTQQALETVKRYGGSEDGFPAAAAPAPTPAATAPAPGEQTAPATGGTWWSRLTNDPESELQQYLAGAPAPATAAADSASPFIGMDTKDGVAVTEAWYVNENGVPTKGAPAYQKGQERSWWNNLSASERARLKTNLYYAGFYSDPDAAKRFLGSPEITAEDEAALYDAMGLANRNGRLLPDLLEDRATQGRALGTPLNTDAADALSEAEVVEGGISFEQSLRQWALNNGIPLTNDFITKNYERVLSGSTSLEEVKQFIREKYIANAFPAFRDEILAGQDVADLAYPYVNRMASLLELPDDAIGLDNPLVKQALQGTDANGKPTYMPLWQFEREVKKDPRWANTTQGRSDITSLGLRVLEDFGLMG